MRPTEVKAVVALLDADHDDVQDLAKDVLRTVDRMREGYDQWSINISVGGVKHSMGPFKTENAAVAAAMSMLGTLDREEAMRYVTKMVNPRWLDEPEVKPRLKAMCEDCGHPVIAHDWPSARVPRGCMVGYVAGDRDSGCTCGR